MRYKTIEDYFFSKVEVTGFCWLWTGRLEKGYGTSAVGGRSTKAHRKSYELLVGPIPDGLTLDHLCRIRNCVNPDHLEPVTHAENVRRAWAIRNLRNLREPKVKQPKMRERHKTHCTHNHELSPENTLVTRRAGRDGFKVRCKTCQHETQERNRRNAGLPFRGRRGREKPWGTAHAEYWVMREAESLVHAA